jgi:hypothetical protein
MAKAHASLKRITRTDTPTSPLSLCGYGRALTKAGPVQEVHTVLDWNVADQTSVERADV